MAGGTEILQATEIRVAGESAQLGIAEVRRGLFPLGGSTVRLQRQIAYTIAADLLLTGRLISAQEAKDIGLIGHVVPDGQALAKARELADLVASNGPIAVKTVLRSMRETAAMTEADGLAHELELGWPVFATNDAKEGPTAFAEKRPPTFTGHLRAARRALSARKARDRAKSPSGSVIQPASSKPAASSSASTFSRRNLALISVRISSPSAKTSVEAEVLDLDRLVGRRRAAASRSTPASASQTRHVLAPLGSKSACSSRSSTRSTLRLNSAVTPAASS